MKKKAIVQELQGIHETLDGIYRDGIPIYTADRVGNAIERIGKVIDDLRKRWDIA